MSAEKAALDLASAIILRLREKNKNLETALSMVFDNVVSNHRGDGIDVSLVLGPAIRAAQEIFKETKDGK